MPVLDSCCSLCFLRGKAVSAVAVCYSCSVPAPNPIPYIYPRSTVHRVLSKTTFMLLPFTGHFLNIDASPR